MTEQITSHAIAFSFPITPNFSVVFPLILIWSLEISQRFTIFFTILFFRFLILGVCVIIFISILLIRYLFDFIWFITFLSKIVDLMFLNLLFLKNNFQFSLNYPPNLLGLVLCHLNQHSFLNQKDVNY